MRRALVYAWLFVAPLVASAEWSAADSQNLNTIRLNVGFSEGHLNSIATDLESYLPSIEEDTTDISQYLYQWLLAWSKQWTPGSSDYDTSLRKMLSQTRGESQGIHLALTNEVNGIVPRLEALQFWLTGTNVLTDLNNTPPQWRFLQTATGRLMPANGAARQSLQYFLTHTLGQNVDYTPSESQRNDWDRMFLPGHTFRTGLNEDIVWGYSLWNIWQAEAWRRLIATVNGTTNTTPAQQATMDRLDALTNWVGSLVNVNVHQLESLQA